MLLFDDNTPHTVLDGELGTVRYFPECVPRETAQRWFDVLLAAVPWSAQRRRMYDRDVDVPRLTAGYDLDAASPPAPILDARAIAERLAAHRFNSVGLNLYRDGNDSVAPHNDKLHELVAGAPIALFSLGATRRFALRTKAAPRRHLDFDLAPGSLLVMSYATQLHLDHGVPKTRVPVDKRMSLVFRERP
ncbi:MAG TPA: alpha-ketoglutarate-dependent dioxygenase AlkB [Rudaea sp.]|nr:alpha-ketoglutarate-dependent dioxygenase AlkB [Rudaea sp.]